MASKSVFRSLQEVFPQIDLRILKAVAIEHANDIDAAVEFILLEVLPLTNGPPVPSFTLHDAWQAEYSSAEGLSKQAASQAYQEVEEVSARMAPGLRLVASESASDDCTKSVYADSQCMRESAIEGSQVGWAVDPKEPRFLEPHCEVVEKSNANPCFVENEAVLTADLKNGSLSDVHPENYSVQQTFNANHEEDSLEKLIVQSCSRLVESRIDALQDHAQEFGEISANETLSGSHTHGQNFSSAILENCSDLMVHGAVVGKGSSSVIESEELSQCPVDLVRNQESHVSEVVTVSDACTTLQDISSMVHDGRSDFIEHGADLHHEFSSSVSESGEQQSSSLANNSAEILAFETEMLSADGNNLRANIISRSGHAVSIEVLEDFINDAKNSKRILLSAMESLNDLNKDVEFLEERATKTKREASTAGQDILEKVEELKQLLKHAQEANDMHAGEVYGERAILATEARELQTRLLSLSDERDKSLSIIEETHKALEARRNAAEKEVAAAEQEKREKEALASEALSEQELIMDTIVEKSKKLQQEAEENSKLREFLMDRGRIVDSLQGEIAVICEDVVLLNTTVAGHVPPSRSLRSTTSSLSSSSCSSSRKSISWSNRAQESLESAENLSMVDQECPQRQPSESVTDGDKEINVGGNHGVLSDNRDKEINVGGNRRVSSDDDWEFF